MCPWGFFFWSLFVGILKWQVKLTRPQREAQLFLRNLVCQVGAVKTAATCSVSVHDTCRIVLGFNMHAFGKSNSNTFFKFFFFFVVFGDTVMRDPFILPLVLSHFEYSRSSIQYLLTVICKIQRKQTVCSPILWMSGSRVVSYITCTVFIKHFSVVFSFVHK